MKTILTKSSLNFTDDNISNILSGRCFSTIFSQRGRKMSISLDSILPVNQKPQCVLQGKDYNDMTDTEKQEFEAYKISQKIKQTLISVIPEKYVKQLKNLEQQNLRKYKELCFASNIMNEAQYEVFKAFVEKNDKEKHKIVNEICYNWDKYLENFKNEISIKYPYISEVEISSAAARKIGSAKDFRNSYKTTIELMPLPNVASAAFLPSSVQDLAINNANKNAEKMITDAIGNAFNNLFDSFNKVLLSNKNNKGVSDMLVSPKTKGTLQANIAISKANLSFLGITEIDNLLNEIDILANGKDDVKLVQESEPLLYKIYNFMGEEDLLEYLDFTNSFIPESAFILDYQNHPNSVATNVINNVDETTADDAEEEIVYW